jgi:hypothetical protein
MFLTMQSYSEPVVIPRSGYTLACACIAAPVHAAAGKSGPAVESGNTSRRDGDTAHGTLRQR